MTGPPSTSPLRTRRARRILALVLGLSLALNLVPVWWGLPDFFSWAVDEIRPEQVRGGRPWPAKYPPLHRFVLRAAFSPVEALTAAGVVPPTGLARHSALFLIARLVSVLMATATVWLVYRAGRQLFGREAALLGALALALSPPFVYYAKTVNLEAPYLFWFALSLFFYLAAVRRHRLRDYLLFAATATLAVATKDQAYALYLVSPLFLVAALWRRHRRASADRSALLATISDPRLLLAFVIPFALTAAIWAVEGGFAGWLRHLRAITGPGSVPYREFEPTLAGQGTMAVRALANAAFPLGLPVTLAALVGLARAMRRPAANLRLLGLAAIALGYYFGFIAVIGYHYVRFFLPVAILLALPAGKALADLLAARWCPRPVSRAAVAAVFAWCLLRALAVDAAMAGDARYAAERWLRENPTPTRVLGLGPGNLLPRWIRALPWRTLERGGCDLLVYLDAEYIAVNTGIAYGPREAQLLAALEAGHLGYELAIRHRRGRALDLLGVDRVHSNLRRVDPEISIYRRSDRRCLDAESLAELADEARLAGRAETRRELAAALAAKAPGTVRLGEARAAGLGPGRWTRGTAAAALWVENRAEKAAVPQIALACGAADPPLSVGIDDGGRRRETKIGRRGRRLVRLRRLAPGGERLVLVWAERACRPAAGGGRGEGVRIKRLTLRR